MRSLACTPLAEFDQLGFGPDELRDFRDVARRIAVSVRVR